MRASPRSASLPRSRSGGRSSSRSPLHFRCSWPWAWRSRAGRSCVGRSSSIASGCWRTTRSCSRSRSGPPSRWSAWRSSSASRPRSCPLTGPTRSRFGSGRPRRRASSACAAGAGAATRSARFTSGSATGSASSCTSCNSMTCCRCVSTRVRRRSGGPAPARHPGLRRQPGLAWQGRGDRVRRHPALRDRRPRPPNQLARQRPPRGALRQRAPPGAEHRRHRLPRLVHGGPRRPARHARARGPRSGVPRGAVPPAQGPRRPRQLRRRSQLAIARDRTRPALPHPRFRDRHGDRLQLRVEGR